MIVMIKYERFEYDYYSRGDDQYTLVCKLSDSQLYSEMVGEGEGRALYSDSWIFGVPSDWQKEKAEKYGETLISAAYKLMTGDSSHYSNMRDGVEKMIKQKLAEIYTEFLNGDL